MEVTPFSLYKYRASPQSLSHPVRRGLEQNGQLTLRAIRKYTLLEGTLKQAVYSVVSLFFSRSATRFLSLKPFFRFRCLLFPRLPFLVCRRESVLLLAAFVPSPSLLFVFSSPPISYLFPQLWPCSSPPSFLCFFLQRENASNKNQIGRAQQS